MRLESNPVASQTPSCLPWQLPNSHWDKGLFCIFAWLVGFLKKLHQISKLIIHSHPPALIHKSHIKRVGWQVKGGVDLQKFNNQFTLGSWMFLLLAKTSIFAFLIMLKHSFGSNRHQMLKTSEIVTVLDSCLYMHIVIKTACGLIFGLNPWKKWCAKAQICIQIVLKVGAQVWCDF